jgi:hypothetical protein
LIHHPYYVRCIINDDLIFIVVIKTSHIAFDFGAFLNFAHLFVIVVEIAILTFALGVGKSVWMRTGISVTIAAILVIAMIAHPLRIVLLIRVRALVYVCCLSFALFIGCIIAVALHNTRFPLFKETLYLVIILTHPLVI